MDVPAAGAVAESELLAGLRAPQPSIEPRWFYDDLGSRLFEAICELPEYYVTRTEAAIFAAHADDLARAVGAAPTLIDLGAGNCEKAAALFDVLQPAQYVAVDIAADFLHQRLTCIQQRFAQLDIVGVSQDFSRQLVLPPQVAGARRLFFYPGSSIGNFSPDQALAFLRRVHQQCGADGALLIGVDLVKDAVVLQAAYDDALGVTAAFNRNVLLHVNRRLGADFDVHDFLHVARFNAAAARIEMELHARRAVRVRLPDGALRLAAGTRILTEHSYKYRAEDFARMLGAAGFARVTRFADAQAWFALFLAWAR